MQSSIDGDIKLSVGVDTQPAEKSVSKLKGIMQDALKQTAGGAKATGFDKIEQMSSKAAEGVKRFVKEFDKTDNANSKLLQLESNVDKAAEKLETAKAKLNEYNQTQVTKSEDFKAIQKEIGTATAKIDKLIELQIQWQEMGLVKTEGFQDLDRQIEALSNHIDELKAKQSAMQADSGFAADTAKYVQLNNAVEQAGREYDIAKTKLAEYNSQQNAAAAGARNLGGSLKGTGSAAKSTKNSIVSIGQVAKQSFGKVGNVAKKAFNTVKKQALNAKNSVTGVFKKIDKSLSMSIKKLLKYTIGIRSLFILFRKLRTMVGEGYKNLAGYSDEVNQSISGVLSAFTKLKNQLAAAFQPLVSVVAPILANFIDIISQATFKIAQFFAALTGQQYVYKALDTQTQFVESLENTADAAKDAKKELNEYLSPLDEISKFSSQNKDLDETGVGVDPSTMFETVEIDEKFKETADKFRNFIDEIKQMINNEDWTGIGEKVGGLFNRINEKINEFLTGRDWEGTGSKIATLINGLFTTVDFKLIGNNLGEGIKGILEFLDGFLNTLGWETLGKKFADLFNGIFDVLSLSTLTEDIANALNGITEMFDNFLLNTKWEEIGANIGESVNSFFETIDLDMTAKTLKDLGQSALDFLTSVITNIDWNMIGSKIGKFVGDSLADLISIDGIISALQFIGDILIAGLDLISGVISGLLEGFIQSFVDNVNTFAENILKFFGVDTTQLEKENQTIEDGIGDIAYTIGYVLTSGLLTPLTSIATGKEIPEQVERYKRDFMEGINTIFSPIVNFFTDAVDAVKKAFDQYIQDWQNGINAISKFFTEDIPQWFTDRFNEIKEKFDFYITCWKEGIAAIGKFFTEDIPKWFTDRFNDIKSKFNTYATDFKNGIDTIGKFFTETIPQWFTDRFNDIKKKFDGYAEDWKKGIATIGSFFTETIPNWFNGLLDQAKKLLGISTGDESPKAAGKASTAGISNFTRASYSGKQVLPQINIPIPKLAQGAVLPPNKPFLAMVGDQKSGTNIEAPLSTITEALLAALSKLGIGNGNGKYEFVANINRRTLFDEIIDEARLRQTVSGRNPFEF